LSISSVESAGEEVVVKFNAAANTGGDRETTLTFRTSVGSKSYSTQTMLSQTGAIINATVAEFLAAEVGNTLYRLTGVVTDISNASDGRLNLNDYSGETYVYKIQDFNQSNVKVGDIITIVGKRAAYNGSPQVSGAVLENILPITATKATIAEVLTKADDSNTYYIVSGEIVSIANQDYGNLTLKDGDSEIYVYGCYPKYGATGDDRKGLLAAKGIKAGDTLTVIATKGSYQGSPQLSHGFYFSHVSAE
jgi:hypothetical protein